MAREVERYEPEPTHQRSAYEAGLQLARELLAARAAHEEVTQRKFQKTEHKLHVMGDGEYTVSDETTSIEEHTTLRRNQ